MILITGGGGFIGLNTAKYLVDEGEGVVLLKRRPFQIPPFLKQYEGNQVKVVAGDILELPFLYSLVKEYKIESIIHLASMHEPEILYRVLKANVEGTTEILETARIFGLRRVTFCSSEAVYLPADNSQLFREEMAFSLHSPDYISATKKAGEHICHLYAKQYAMSVPIVRPPRVWGPLYHSGIQPIQLMVENSITGKFSNFSRLDGDKLGNFVYIKDCARAIGMIHLAPKLSNNVYNVSDIIRHSLSEFKQAIMEFIPEANISLGGPGENSTDDPPMNIDRIREDLGFTPEYDLKKGIKDYLGWLKEGNY